MLHAFFKELLENRATVLQSATEHLSACSLPCSSVHISTGGENSPDPFEL